MKITRTLWPYGIMAAFGLFFAGMVTMVSIAASHKEDLVSEDYYEHELKFQDQIDGAVRARDAGATVRFVAAAREVVVALPTMPSAQIALGKVEFYRADAPGLDRTVMLDLRREGTQTVDAAHLAAGPWDLRVSWEMAGKGYYLEQKIVIPAN